MRHGERVIRGGIGGLNVTWTKGRRAEIKRDILTSERLYDRLNG